jgi:geranylgeranyl transferase type-2 subunit beta
LFASFLAVQDVSMPINMPNISSCRGHLACALLVWMTASAAAQQPTSDEVLKGLRDFYRATARADGSFQPGIDPSYRGMSDSAYSDVAAVTYACVIHKTFGWELPHREKTVQWLLARQRPEGDFASVAGTVDPKSPQGRTYNTTQALVALRSLGVKPTFDPLPVFEEILRQDYKTLPAYSTSFFPLAYLCAGRPIPEQADRAIRALMVQSGDGYLNDHVAATFHASHYYALVGEPTPKAELMVARMLRDQNANGSWLLNPPARDRHATFDAVFTLRHEGQDQPDCQAAIARAAKWALSCRNADGGFGHFPGSTSDADAVYFQVGTLVMAGVLEPANPLPGDPHLLGWGHLLPLRKPAANQPLRLTLPGWIGGLAFSPDGKQLAIACSDGVTRISDSRSGQERASFKGHTDCVACVAFAPDGRRLATGGFDHLALVRDAQTGAVVHSLAGHTGAVLSVAYAPGGSFVATGSIDQTIRLWDAFTGQHERTLVGHKSWVNSVAFTPDNERLISGSSDGTVRIWSVASGELLKTIDATPAEVRSVAVSPDGKRVAAGIRYGVVKLWDAADGKEIRTWTSPGDDVWAVAFSEGSRRLFTAAGEWNRPAAVAAWDAQTGESLARYQHTGEVLSLAVSPDGQQVAAGGGDRSISVWSVPKDAGR